MHDVDKNTSILPLGRSGILAGSMAARGISQKHPMNVLLQGDNNWGDDRALYNTGQRWLNLNHLMGRVVGCCSGSLYAPQSCAIHMTGCKFCWHTHSWPLVFALQVSSIHWAGDHHHE